jgi:hypothetical protein
MNIAFFLLCFAVFCDIIAKAWQFWSIQGKQYIIVDFKMHIDWRCTRRVKPPEARGGRHAVNGKAVLR